MKKDLSNTFYFCDVLKFHFKRTLKNTATNCKEEEHINNQHMKIKFVDNGVCRGGTTSSGPVSRWCRLLHYVLSIKMMYTEMMS